MRDALGTTTDPAVPEVVRSVLLDRPGAVEGDGPDTGVAGHYGDPLREQRLITEGLAPQERVVVDGLQKIRPGMEVRAVAAAERGASPGTQTDPTATSARPAQASDAQPGSAPAQVAGASGSSSSAKGAVAPDGAQRDASASEVARR